MIFYGFSSKKKFFQSLSTYIDAKFHGDPFLMVSERSGPAKLVKTSKNTVFWRNSQYFGHGGVSIYPTPHCRLFPSTKQPVPAGCEWSGRYFVVDSPDRWFRPFRLDFGVVFCRFRTQKPVLELFPEFSPHPRLVFSEKQPGPVSFQRSGLVRVVDSSAGEIEHSGAGALFKTILSSLKSSSF